MKYFLLQIFLVGMMVNIEIVKCQEPTSDADSSQQSFNICPPDFIWAYDNGRRCCDGLHMQRAQLECLKFNPCPQGENPKSRKCLSSIPCPNGGDCESYKSRCQSVLQVESEDPYNGNYIHNPNVTDANKPVYSGPGGCIWWHRKSRHWFVGACEYIGTDAGFAYLEIDVNCPYEGFSDNKWTVKESNTTWSVTLSVLIPEENDDATPAKESSRPTLFNIKKEGGKYLQECKWIFKNGTFECSNKN